MIILRKPRQSAGIILLGEKPSGAIDGVNQTYTTAYNYRPGKIQVFYNGQALHSPDDFTETGYNEFQLTYMLPDNTDELRVTYEVDGCIGPVPTNCLTEDDHDNLPHYFLDLYDTPPTFSGSEGEFVRVNSTGTALEFVTTSGIINEQYGIEDIPNGADNVSVTFPRTFNDSDYTLTTDIENTVDSKPSAFASVISAKSNSGFTVIFSGDIDSVNYKLNWLAKKN
jgi:hypothetical protein